MSDVSDADAQLRVVVVVRKVDDDLTVEDEILAVVVVALEVAELVPDDLVDVDIEALRVLEREVPVAEELDGADAVEVDEPDVDDPGEPGDPGVAVFQYAERRD